MSRVAGPEAHSCASCHNQPRVGGGGDFATNVFMMPDSVTSTTDSISSSFSNERRTVSIFGAGPIEMVAREMTFQLHAIRNAAINQAFLSARNVPAHLMAKGIDFGSIVAHPDGTVDASGVRGVSPDLVIRPFHQDGEAVSIRHFTNDAMNQHLGIQSQERFGIDVDADGDGVVNELTVGDVTAISYLAQLATPGRVIPSDPAKRQATQDGEEIFQQHRLCELSRSIVKIEQRRIHRTESVQSRVEIACHGRNTRGFRYDNGWRTTENRVHR